MAEVYAHVPNQVARMVGNDSVMDEVAHQLLSIAIARAMAHRLTGNYLASLGVANVPGKKGVRDRIVYADDPAAISIEWGHWASATTWVPGQHILGGAVAAMPGGRGPSRYP